MTSLSSRAAWLIAGLSVLGLAGASGLRAEPVPASATAKPAEEKKGPLGPALFDKKKPIEITSDRLDVDQDTHIAIFQGKVDAIQGDIHLRADKLTVYYDDIETQTSNGTQTAPQTAPAPAAASAATPAQAGVDDPTGSGGKIRRMDVDGNVFVSSPTETASGEKGVYLAETGKITLTGNVILTRAGNVIRGTKLVIDVDSGRSIIDANSSAGGGRVKGLFVPKKDQTIGPGPAKDAKASNTKTTAESAAPQ